MRKMLLPVLILFCFVNINIAFSSTVFKKDFTCPVDGKKFTATLAGSGTSFETHLDFKAEGAIISPWPIPQCPECGVIIFENKYTKEQQEKLKEFILSKKFKDVWKSHTPYYCFGLIMEYMNPNDSFSIGDKFLQSSWESGKQYKAYAQKAIEHFSKVSNPAKDGKIPPDKISEYKNFLISRYLLVELNRRCEQWDAVNAAFKDLEKADMTKGPEWIAMALKIQKDLTAKKDSTDRTFGEFKKDKDKDKDE